MSLDEPRWGTARAVLAVVATYGYFLLWAQFGFLEHLRAALTSAQVQGAMGAMGVAGLLTSFTAAAALKHHPPQRFLRASFVACAASAVVALAATDPLALGLAAAAIGASTAALTVTLATGLRELLPGPHFGLKVGLGTGLAYFLCNLPVLFEGSPLVAAVFTAALCLLAAVLLPTPAERSEQARTFLLAPADFRRWGFAAVVLSFLALVWLDSAAFAVIQETEVLKGGSWGSGLQKLAQGSFHLLAALAAGAWLDRGRLRSLLVSAYGLFAVAFALLGALGGAPATGVALVLAGPLYAVGISFYSVALVVYPGAAPAAEALVSPRWRAGLGFGVAGWVGSAMGVGMAQDLHRVPRAFLLAAGALLVAAWGLSYRRQLRGLWRFHGGTLVGLSAGLLVAFYLGLTVTILQRSQDSGSSADAPRLASSFQGAYSGEAELVQQGRRIYIQEGCINCHSQYVRPETADGDLWGPHRPLDRGEKPPLPGNRRQGPDLSMVGARRNAQWQRLHLRDPQSVVPASRMPSYAHLFTGDGRRGEALVAYLGSLGQAQRGERWAAVAAVEPEVASLNGSIPRGRELFGRWCANCHGSEGGGDGPLAAELDRPALDLTKDGFWWMDRAASGSRGGANAADQERTFLARTIRYGLEGTSMAGHEYLTEEQVADLVAFVTTLPATHARSGHSPAAGAGMP
jgi:cytochrome c oxidase cbb3-type subunit 2